jgi:hypothetical protein
MTDTEGILQMQPSGRWVVRLPGYEPVEIPAGEIFLLEVQGERKLMRVRMEHRDGKWYAVVSQRRVELRDGLRAGFFDQRERYAKAMTDDSIGILKKQPSGHWAICRPGRDPVEIASGELFRVEVAGELRVTRMEHLWGEGYYSVDPLRDGMRAAIGEEG